MEVIEYDDLVRVKSSKGVFVDLWEDPDTNKLTVRLPEDRSTYQTYMLLSEKTAKSEAVKKNTISRFGRFFKALF